jgi:hypothetical protein
MSSPGWSAEAQRREESRFASVLDANNLSQIGQIVRRNYVAMLRVSAWAACLLSSDDHFARRFSDSVPIFGRFAARYLAGSVVWALRNRGDLSSAGATKRKRPTPVKSRASCCATRHAVISSARLNCTVPANNSTIYLTTVKEEALHLALARPIREPIL